MEDQEYVFLNSFLKYKLYTIKYLLILHVPVNDFSNKVVQRLLQSSLRTVASLPEYLF